MQLFAAQIGGYPDYAVMLAAGIFVLLVGGSTLGILVLSVRKRLSKARQLGEKIPE